MSDTTDQSNVQAGLSVHGGRKRIRVIIPKNGGAPNKIIVLARTESMTGSTPLSKEKSHLGKLEKLGQLKPEPPIKLEPDNEIEHNLEMGPDLKMEPHIKMELDMPKESYLGTKSRSSHKDIPITMSPTQASTSTNPHKETNSSTIETNSSLVETNSSLVETNSSPVETNSSLVETNSSPVETNSNPVETSPATLQATTHGPVNNISCQDRRINQKSNIKLANRGSIRQAVSFCQDLRENWLCNSIKQGHVLDNRKQNKNKKILYRYPSCGCKYDEVSKDGKFCADKKKLNPNVVACGHDNCGHDITHDCIEDMLKILPVGYNYSICEYSKHGDGNFITSFYIAGITSHEEGMRWRERFQIMNLCQYNVKQSYSSGRAVFTWEGFCHRGFTTSKTTQQTGCEASMHIKTYHASCWNHLPCKTWRTQVKLHHCHNHPLKDAQRILCRLRPEVKAKFLSLFAQGHSPSSALRQYLNDPELDKMGVCEQTAIDRTVVPNLETIARLYNKTKVKDSISIEDIDLPLDDEKSSQKTFQNDPDLSQEHHEHLEDPFELDSSVSSTKDSSISEPLKTASMSSTHNLTKERCSEYSMTEIMKDVPQKFHKDLKERPSQENREHLEDNLEVNCPVSSRNEPLDAASISSTHNLTKEKSVEYLMKENDRLQKENKRLQYKLSQVSQQLALVLKEKERLMQKLAPPEQTNHPLASDDLETMAVSEPEPHDESTDCWSGFNTHIPGARSQVEVDSLHGKSIATDPLATTSQQNASVLSPSNLHDITSNLEDEISKYSFRDSNMSRRANSHGLTQSKGSAETPNADLANDHSKLPPNKNFHCNVCKKGFVTKVALIHHSAQHKKGPFMCQHCGKTFNSMSTLSAHVAYRHSKRNFSCNVCGAKYHSKSDLKRHEFVHLQQRPFICETCGAGFVRHYQLRNHRKKNHTS